MGRKHRKRGKGVKHEDEPQTEVGPVASDYLKKYQALPNKTATTTGGWTGISGGTPTTSTYTYKKKDCKHWRDECTLAEGIIIKACAHRDHPKENWVYPEMGVYFASSWDDFSPSSLKRNSYADGWKGPKKLDKDVKVVNNEIAVIDWPDMGVPPDTEYTLKVLEYTLNQAAEGVDIEIGCIGGHGRTGTALAAMLIMLGEDNADEAMTWVWDEYCEHAIESQKQEDWLWAVAKLCHPETAPELYEQRKTKKVVVPTSGTPLAHQTPSQSQLPMKTGSEKLLSKIEETLDTCNDGEEGYERWWLTKAAVLFDNLITMGCSTEQAMDEAVKKYDVDATELYEFLGVWDGETIDPETDTTKGNEYDEWQALNDQILASLVEEVEDGHCTLCKLSIKECACFENTGVGRLWG